MSVYTPHFFSTIFFYQLSILKSFRPFLNNPWTIIPWCSIPPCWWEQSVIHQGIEGPSVGLLGGRWRQGRSGNCFRGGWVGPVKAIKREFWAACGNIKTLDVRITHWSKGALNKRGRGRPETSLVVDELKGQRSGIFHLCGYMDVINRLD